MVSLSSALDKSDFSIMKYKYSIVSWMSLIALFDSTKVTVLWQNLNLTEYILDKKIMQKIPKKQTEKETPTFLWKSFNN